MKQLWYLMFYCVIVIIVDTHTPLFKLTIIFKQTINKNSEDLINLHDYLSSYHKFLWAPLILKISSTTHASSRTPYKSYQFTFLVWFFTYILHRFHPPDFVFVGVLVLFSCHLVCCHIIWHVPQYHSSIYFVFASFMIFTELLKMQLSVTKLLLAGFSSILFCC